MTTKNLDLHTALVGIRNDPRFAPFRAQLQTMLLRELRALIGLEGNLVYRAQGAARVIEELQQMIEASRTEPDHNPADGIKTASNF